MDGLFDSFSDESLSDIDDHVGELSDGAGGKTDTDSDGYSDVSGDECDDVNAEDELRTVLSILDDALFHFC